MTEFYKVIQERCSNREFDKTRKVEADKLNRILEAMQRAPTACNKQPFKILVIQSQDILDKVCENYSRSWLQTAPMIVAILGNAEMAWKRFNGTSAHVIDASIAMDHLILAATAEGLGSCWICAYDQEKMAECLQIPKGWEVVAIAPIGYATKFSAHTTRKSLEDLVEYR